MTTVSQKTTVRLTGTVKKALLGTALALLALTLIGGYGFNWSWTGFPGNTLWDWMNLLLLPVTLGLLSLAFELSTGMLLRVAGAAALVLAVMMIGGYGFGWSWTGFQGNTLWDWLHLLVVPVTLPFVAHELGERQKQRALADAQHKRADLAGPDLARPDLARPDLARPDLARVGPDGPERPGPPLGPAVHPEQGEGPLR
jgi:hypothetical protein